MIREEAWEGVNVSSSLLTFRITQHWEKNLVHEYLKLLEAEIVFSDKYKNISCPYLPGLSEMTHKHWI